MQPGTQVEDMSLDPPANTAGDTLLEAQQVASDLVTSNGVQSGQNSGTTGSEKNNTDF